MRHTATCLLLAATAALPTLAGSGATASAPSDAADVVVDNTPDSIEKARTARPMAGSSRRGDNPVLFLVGNSTMRTGTLGNGDNGQWGWGYYFQDMFDTAKITVENHALGGMSTRTFYKQLWPDVLDGVRKGDYVIIELGHNDNGPYDSGRARATINGTGDERLPVVIRETGERDTVLTYGGYLRRYVRETKARGATPVLFSLTPRKAWADRDSTRIVRVDSTYGLWASQIAAEEGVPFVDLNDITASEYERFGKRKVETMFYLDRIHTSAFGAIENALSAAEGIRAINLPLKDWLLPSVPDTLTGSTREEGRHVVFIIGDSTVKNEDKDDDSMWGWGSVVGQWFNPDSVSVENHAMAGRSARTFLDEGRWDKVYNALKPGDVVLMQFGHNDGGDINTGKARGELHGYGPESKVFRMEKTGTNQVVYTYGWYLRKFIYDTLEKGAIPVVVGHTPRNKWADGRIESNAADFGLWARMAAREAGAWFVDLNAITGKKLMAVGQEQSAKYFKNDHTHTSLAGALLNARGVADGLRDVGCPVRSYLLPVDCKFVHPDKAGKYDALEGYGRETFGNGSQSTFFSVEVPDGNYIVEMECGDAGNGHTPLVRTENRRLLSMPKPVGKGSPSRMKFAVNKRSAPISLADTVKLNAREIGVPSWDGKLTFETVGKSGSVKSIRVREVQPADSVVTVFLAGNSTVVDQAYEPWCSWGQVIPSMFDEHVAVSNHAESGESAESFLAGKRFDKLLSMASAGDWIFIEFGHNDQKERGPGKGAYYNFATNLKIMIDRAREASLHPVLVTPAARRAFDGDSTVNTHGEYVDAVREVARRENVPLIDLNAASRRLYESLGAEGSKTAFVHYPADTFKGQKKALADNTHFNPYGAYLIALCMAEGMKDVAPQLADHFREPVSFDPQTPPSADSFGWIMAPLFESEKPYGD